MTTGSADPVAVTTRNLRVGKGVTTPITNPSADPGTEGATGRTQGARGNEYSRASAWCNSPGKRIFDLVSTSVFLILALPPMLLASLAVATSPGPLLFGADRMGQGGKRIRVLKFRTMAHRKELGLPLTRKGDGRVTKAGRFLRQWKIDELPQLINVMRGDMSLVGPRPDSAEFLDALPTNLQCVRTLKPGITSTATLKFRNEEDLLSSVPENELASYYQTTLLPEKVRLDLDYARHATLLTDLKLLIKTALAILR